MGDEGLQMDTTPVFSVPRKRVKEGKKEKRGSGSEDDTRSTPPPPSSTLNKAVRFALFLSLIPAMYFVPFVLRFAGAKVKANYHLLIYLWSFYSVVLVSIFFYFKRKTITLDSFVTQIMGWMIVTLGIYHLVDLPKMVDITLRKDVLYVWCSFTMIFNLLWFFFDEKDYQEEKRKEDEKEERRKKKEEERKKKEADKRKKRLDRMMSPATRRIVNFFIYIAIIAIAGLIIQYIYNYNLHLQELEALERGEVPYEDPVYNFDDVDFNA